MAHGWRDQVHKGGGITCTGAAESHAQSPLRGASLIPRGALTRSSHVGSRSLGCNDVLKLQTNSRKVGDNLHGGKECSMSAPWRCEG
jgi:hypothetical protein